MFSDDLQEPQYRVRVCVPKIGINVSSLSFVFPAARTVQNDGWVAMQ